MFKTRKVNLSLATNRTPNRQQFQWFQTNASRATRRSYTPSKLQNSKTNHQEKWNQQVLYAKSVILQINQELDMKVLTRRSFQQKTKLIIKNLKKCNSQDKYLILIQLTSFHQKFGIQFSDELYDSITNLIGFLNRLSKYNQKKLHELIIIYRIDKVLVHIVKSYPTREYEIIEKLEQVVKKINSMIDKFRKIMEQNQYNNLVKNIMFLNRKEVKKNKYKKQQNSQNEILIERKNVTSMSRESLQSNNSNRSEQTDEKLKKQQKMQQNIELLKKIYQNCRRNKKQIRKVSGIRFNSIKINNNQHQQRVSCIWGKQPHRDHQDENELIVCNQKCKNISILPNGSIHCNSVPLIKKNQRLQSISSDQQLHYSKQTVQIKQEWFHPFYLYAIIKGIIRVNQISSAQIVGNNVGIRIHFQGYFTYPLTIFRLPNTFFQNKSTDKLQKFLMVNLQLKKKNIWTVLQLKHKIRTQKFQVVHRNVISEAVFAEESYLFYGFVKKTNVYFFTQYKSKKINNRIGTLTIYDPLFQNILERVQIQNWKKKLNINFQEVQNKIQDNLERNQVKNKCISVMETTSKIRSWEVKKIKNLKKNKNKGHQNLYLKKYRKRNNNAIHVVMQRQGKFAIISETKKNNEITYSNLVFEHRFRNLFVIKFHENLSVANEVQAKQNLFETQVSFFLKKGMNPQPLAIINKRMGKPQYINIRYQKYFIKKIKNIGSILCRIILFQPTQSQLILSEAYLPKHQRYYTFFLKPTLINNFFNSNQKQNTLQENLNYLIRLIRIKKNLKLSTSHEQQIHLILEVGQVIIEGRQLVYRQCIYNQKQKIKYIDSIMFEKLANTKICNEIILLREMNKISKNLYNQCSETITIQNPKTSKKYGKYSEFINAIKDELNVKLQRIQMIFRKKIKNRYYYRFKIKNNYWIKKVDFCQKQQMVQTYNISKCQSNKLIYPKNIQKNDFILSKLKGKSLIKYFGRILKDPLIFQLYVNYTEQQKQCNGRTYVVQAKQKYQF